MFITYKITCIITGKYYIGSHKTDNVDDGYMGSGKFIRDSIAKYGVENHTKDILGIFDNRKESLELEHSLVKEKRAREREMCLNASDGGYDFDYVNATGKNVYKRTPEQRQKQINGLKKGLETISWCRENIPGYKEAHQKRSGDTSRNYYATHSGPWLGRHHTEDTKLKMRNSAAGKHTGEKNSQFGTYWITNGYTNAKWSDSRGDIPNGYWKGRKL